MKLKLLLFALALLPLSGMAQEHWCATDEVHQQMLNEDEDYAQLIARQNKSWSDFASQTQSINAVTANSTDEIYEIPVVFHVIHTGQSIGSPENPSEAFLQSAIDELNQKFSATWSDFPGVTEGGVAVPVQFAMAQRDPDCQPTNGINRVDGSNLDGYLEYGVARPDAEGASDLALKSLSRWSNSDYVNVWVVTDISSTSSGMVTGYATYPGASPLLDGIVLRHNFLTNKETFAHEAGHLLGLRHTFQGGSETECPPNDNCTVDGDMICDTAPHLKTTGCDMGLNTCTGSSIVPVVHNIMNYGSCRDRFTEGQKDRMMYSLLNHRYSLTTSFGATAVDEEPEDVEAPIAATCEPLGIENEDNNYNIGIHNIQLAEINHSSSGFTSDEAYYVDNTLESCLSPRKVAYLQNEESHTIYITTGYNKENVRAWIDFNNDGMFDEEDSIALSLGTVNNEQHSATFVIPSFAVLNTPLRLRVASDYYTLGLPQACGMMTYGQVEDYTVVIQGNVGLQDVNVEKIKMYPNPVADVLYLSDKLEDIEVYTTDGRIVMTAKTADYLDVSALPTGTYIIHAKNASAKNAQGTFVKK